MKSRNFFPLLAAMMVLAVGWANAQIGYSNVRADIPFEFTVGAETLPAGQYTVSKVNDLGTLAISGGGSAKIFASSNAVESGTAQKMTKLVFHRYGDRYFLYRIWVEGDDRGRELPKTNLERELASNRKPNSVAVLAVK